jgi:hypothetical protein
MFIHLSTAAIGRAADVLCVGYQITKAEKHQFTEDFKPTSQSRIKATVVAEADGHPCGMHGEVVRDGS